MWRIGLFASLALMLAACASADGEASADGANAAAGGRECFRSESVSGFSVVDRNTVEVRVGANRRYRLTTSWPTHDLDFSQRIAIRSATGQICTGSGLGVEIIGGDPQATYPIRSIARAPEPAPEAQE
jgi:hypothetical protein